MSSLASKSETVKAQRLIEQPIIFPDLHPTLGNNINGPSVIRAPRWVTNPLAKYYLYFAHHEGRHIRLAYANSMQGPWTIYAPGVLKVEDSHFVSEDIAPQPDKGGSSWAQKFGNVFQYAHVASPHVLVDDENQTVYMYYHGLLENGDQQTRLAISKDGIGFVAQPALLGPPYFRVWRYKNMVYSFSWGGQVMRSEHLAGPFERGPNLLEDSADPESHHGFRHGEVLLQGDLLHLFYTRIGDCPEHIVYRRITLCDDWTKWKVDPAVSLLGPECKWEGAESPLSASKAGAADGCENALRDPCVFTDDDGTHYLLYAGGGESAIGIATLSGISV